MNNLDWTSKLLPGKNKSTLTKGMRGYIKQSGIREKMNMIIIKTKML